MGESFMIKRIFAMLLCLALALGITGCTENVHPITPVEDRVTLEWYVNFSWFNTKWGGNAVSETISEKTGVDINFISPNGSETETLNALIAGDKLPDIVTLGWWEDQFSIIIDGGMAYALNELADEYDSYFWEVADEDRLAWYTRADGNVYCYPNSSYTPKNYEESDSISSNQTFLVRKDIYEAIGSPDMTTPEGFLDAVRKAKEMFPTVDGKPLIPVGAHEFTEYGCDSFDKFLLNFLAVPYEKDGEFYDRFTDPEYKLWLSVFRQLGEEGLLSSDIFIDKRAQMEEKVSEGRYFCMLYQHTDIADIQRQRYENDPDSIYIAIDGPRNSNGDPYTLPGAGINGWTVTLISKNCQHPDMAIRLMSFLMSEEGQKLTALGIEGEHYNMVDGRAVLTEETRELLYGDYQTYLKEVGGNDAYWMLMDNLMQSEWDSLDEPALLQMAEWTYPYLCYTGQYDVSFTPGTEVCAAEQRIEAIHGEMLPKLLLAPTEEDFELLWDEYVSRREQAGLSLVLEESTRQMNEAKEKLGLS